MTRKPSWTKWFVNCITCVRFTVELKGLDWKRLVAKMAFVNDGFFIRSNCRPQFASWEVSWVHALDVCLFMKLVITFYWSWRDSPLEGDNWTKNDSRPNRYKTATQGITLEQIPWYLVNQNSSKYINFIKDNLSLKSRLQLTMSISFPNSEYSKSVTEGHEFSRQN